MYYAAFLFLAVFVFYFASRLYKQIYELEKRFVYVQVTYNDRIKELETRLFLMEQSLKKLPADSQS